MYLFLSNAFCHFLFKIFSCRFFNNFNPEVQAGTPKGLQRMRDLAEEALNFHGAGLHCTEGSKLWDWFLNFELSQESKEDITPEEREEATERVRKLYRRRLAVPVHDLEETMKAYIAWEKERKNNKERKKNNNNGTATEDGKKEEENDDDDDDDFTLVPKHVKRSFDFARRAYELRQPFEEALAGTSASPEDLLSSFMSYIKLEEGGTTEDSSTVSRVEVLYERAVAAFPVTSFLWLQYSRYMEVVVQSSSAAQSIYARGIRNCPWVGELYEKMMRLVERTGTTSTSTEGDQTGVVSLEFEERHEAIFNRALTAPLLSPDDYALVGLARLDFLRRKSQLNTPIDTSASFERICGAYNNLKSTIQEKFPDYYDPLFQLAEYSASLGRKFSGSDQNIEASRNIWEDALKAGRGAAARCATGWLKYIEYLKCHLPRGSSFVQGIRDLFTRCYAREMDGYGQVEICNAWLKFEREEGSADDYFNAWCVAGSIIAQATATQTGYAAAAAAAEEATAQQPVLSKEEAKALRQQNDPNYLKKKRKIEQTQQQQQQQQDKIGGGKRFKSGKAPEKTQPDATTTTEPPATVPTGTNGDMNAADAKEVRPKETLNPKDVAARRALTAFIKHLPEENATEDSLRELFSPCGTINHVKLGIDHATGRHKGFAYIEFESPESLEAACRLNGTAMGDKTLFVAPSNPPADGPGGGRGGRGERGGRVGARGRGGRGRGGIGYSGGSGGGGGTHGQVAKATQRSHLDIISGGGKDGINNDAPTSANFKPVVGFVPRAAAIPKKTFTKSGGGGGGEEPKSNSDFRKMLLEKKS